MELHAQLNDTRVAQRVFQMEFAALAAPVADTSMRESLLHGESIPPQRHVRGLRLIAASLPLRWGDRRAPARRVRRQVEVGIPPVGAYQRLDAEMLRQL